MVKIKKTLSILLSAIVFLSISVVPTNVFAAENTATINIKNFVVPQKGGAVSDSMKMNNNNDIELLDSNGNELDDVLHYYPYNITDAATMKTYSSVDDDDVNTTDKFQSLINVLWIGFSYDTDEISFMFDDNGNFLGDITFDGKKLDNVYFSTDYDQTDPDYGEVGFYIVFDDRQPFNVDNLDLSYLPKAGTTVGENELKGNFDFYYPLETNPPKIFSSADDFYDPLDDEDIFENGEEYAIVASPFESGSILFSLEYRFYSENAEFEDVIGFGPLGAMYSFEALFNGEPTEMYMLQLYGINGVVFEVPFTVAEKITVTFDANGHGIVPDKQEIWQGEKVTKPADLTADGYVFEGWYLDKECTKEFNFDKFVYEDTTLYAKWSEAPAEPAPETPETPKTGDSASLFAIAGSVATLSLVGGLIIANKKRKFD